MLHSRIPTRVIPHLVFTEASVIPNFSHHSIVPLTFGVDAATITFSSIHQTSSFHSSSYTLFPFPLTQ